MSSTHILEQLYTTVLTQRLGFIDVKTKPDHDTIIFSHDEMQFVLQHGGSADPQFLSLGLGFVGRALNGGTDPDSQVLTDLAYQVNSTTKLVKVIVHNGLVMASCDLIVAPPSALPTPEFLVAVLPRAMTSVHHAIEKIHTGLQLNGIRTASQ